MKVPYRHPNALVLAVALAAVLAAVAVGHHAGTVATPAQYRAAVVAASPSVSPAAPLVMVTQDRSPETTPTPAAILTPAAAPSTRPPSASPTPIPSATPTFICMVPSPPLRGFCYKPVSPPPGGWVVVLPSPTP